MDVSDCWNYPTMEFPHYKIIQPGNSPINKLFNSAARIPRSTIDITWVRLIYGMALKLARHIKKKE